MRMHKEILSDSQVKLFPFLALFRSRFILVGGTAIALHIGHRRSIDYDLFSDKPFRNILLKRKIGKSATIERVLVDSEGELTFVSSGVKITFFEYPFVIDATERLDDVIELPDLLTLAAMKAYALGKRAKWKDYVDLFFILRDFHSLREIVVRSKKIFGNEFNEKIFRTQLSYFNDVDYSETVEFLPGFEIDDEHIRSGLESFSVKG